MHDDIEPEPNPDDLDNLATAPSPKFILGSIGVLLAGITILWLGVHWWPTEPKYQLCYHDNAWIVDAHGSRLEAVEECSRAMTLDQANRRAAQELAAGAKIDQYSIIPAHTETPYIKPNATPTEIPAVAEKRLITLLYNGFKSPTVGPTRTPCCYDSALYFHERWCTTVKSDGRIEYGPCEATPMPTATHTSTPTMTPTSSLTVVCPPPKTCPACACVTN